MRVPTLVLALVAALFVVPVQSAQTPATTQASGMLLQATIDALASDLVATTGIVRTIYPAGATLHLTTGTGPSLHFVESGSLAISPGDGAAPLVIRAGSGQGSATPAPAASGDDVVVAAGDGFLLSAGVTAEIHNSGAEPATILDLLAAPDAAMTAGEGITQEILVRQEVTLPAATVSVTLGRTTIEKGERVPIAEDPALTFYASVERSAAFDLTGQGFSRLGTPVDVYVLVIAPGGGA